MVYQMKSKKHIALIFFQALFNYVLSCDYTLVPKFSSQLTYTTPTREFLEALKKRDTEILAQWLLVQNFHSYIQTEIDVDTHHNTLLHYAIACGHAHKEIIRALTTSSTINRKNSAGFTPLDLALYYGNYNAANILINYKAHPNKMPIDQISKHNFEKSVTNPDETIIEDTLLTTGNRLLDDILKHLRKDDSTAQHDSTHEGKWWFELIMDTPPMGATRISAHPTDTATTKASPKLKIPYKRRAKGSTTVKAKKKAKNNRELPPPILNEDTIKTILQKHSTEWGAIPSQDTPSEFISKMVNFLKNETTLRKTLLSEEKADSSLLRPSLQVRHTTIKLLSILEKDYKYKLNYLFKAFSDTNLASYKENHQIEDDDLQILDFLRRTASTLSKRKSWGEGSI